MPNGQGAAFNIGGGPVPSLTHREIAENVEMSRWRWETMINRLLTARNKRNWPVVFAALTLFLSVLPMVFADEKNFNLELGQLGTDVWRAVFIIIAAGSLMAVCVLLVRMVVPSIEGRRILWLRWLRLPRRKDWVPTNVAEFVEMVCREVEAEQARARDAQQASSTALPPPTQAP